MTLLEIIDREEDEEVALEAQAREIVEKAKASGAFAQGIGEARERIMEENPQLGSFAVMFAVEAVLHADD